ncbi:riboflavin synthase [Marinihelvus fidelis]|uniref:Riboflavin synthase n=1 Tax=Marinihelvus fidelis TaxID=2613842 RepID=A0A5N0T701_9GAMM|nr:riboflavin synthase [Marinihelvus fidelis]KAA9130753.1 riboflavin synthase [Marinihelvus fidelis]
MFTGIITHQGRLASSDAVGGDRRMVFEVPVDALDGARDGDSMCVSGACLTMLQPGDGRFSADVSAETLALTTLGSLAPGATVNLEPALRAGDPLGGHLVSGHVDGLAHLADRAPDGRAERFGFQAPAALAKYIATKGSICVDGVSLTVNAVAGERFEVCIIPHTLAVTTLGQLAPGDTVNLEVDMVARYLERMLEARDPGANP